MNIFLRRSICPISGAFDQSPISKTERSGHNHKGGKMNNLYMTLFNPLSAKGFTPTEIKGLTRDIVLYFQNNPDYSPGDLNLELESLGWGFSLFDRHLFNQMTKDF
jgi:hypothetical protein